MLEYWYKERRTVTDFRRGPLGPHFDGFAAHLKEKGYVPRCAMEILGKCCIFNAFLIDKGISCCKKITPSVIESFLDGYLSNFRSTSKAYSPRANAQRSLHHLMSYLIESKVVKPKKPKKIVTPYSWILNPYLEYLRDDEQLSEPTIHRTDQHMSKFLESLGEYATRKSMRNLSADTIETYIKQYLKNSPENVRRLMGSLRRFLRYCAKHKYMSGDFSRLIPPIPSYRLASLPKGMEDSALQRMLEEIPKDTPVGSRDYAIALLMMAYGIRGVSVAALLFEDITWPRSTIRIRAQKGGKEVVVPLLDSVGEAILNYLRHRQENASRQVFLRVKAPYRPLNSVAVSAIIRNYMTKAGVKIPGSGSQTLRHSWAIRALAHDSPIKAIADVLGHRCINTTFIYAKADLKALRQVAMPWPEGR